MLFKFWKWLLRTLDSLTTLPDTVFFIWYGLMRNGIKEKRKVEIKQKKGIKSAKMPDLTSLFKTAAKELDAHNEDVPFLIRFIPTVVVSAIILTTVIIVA